MFGRFSCSRRSPSPIHTNRKLASPRNALAIWAKRSGFFWREILPDVTIVIGLFLFLAELGNRMSEIFRPFGTSTELIPILDSSTRSEGEHATTAKHILPSVFSTKPNVTLLNWEISLRRNDTPWGV